MWDPQGFAGRFLRSTVGYCQPMTPAVLAVLLADGIYIGGGVLVIVLIILLLWLIFFR